MSDDPTDDPQAIFCHGTAGRPCNSSWSHSALFDHDLENVLGFQKYHQERYERKVIELARARERAREAREGEQE